MRTENASEKTETKSRVMSVVLEMKQSIVALGGPRQPEDTRESMINRAARKAGISFRQAKSFFYGESSDPRASVVERVRAAIDNANAAQEAKVRDEYRTLVEQIELLQHRLAAIAPHVDSESDLVDRGRRNSVGEGDRSLGGGR